MYYLKRIKTNEFGVFLGTLPYKTVVIGSKFSSIDATLRHKMTIALNDPQSNTTTEITKNICDLAGKKITVSYSPANPEDTDTVATYGGLLNTPANLLHVKAVVRVDDTVVLEGPEIGMGQPLKLKATFTGQGRPDEFMETDMSAGIYYNIGLSALNVADKQASTALDNSNNLVTTFFDSINNGDNQAGKVLHNIAQQYFTHTNNDSKVLEGVMQIHNTRSANAGFVSVTAKYNYTLGAPTSPPIISGLLMDLRRFIQSPFSITGDADQGREFTKIQGLSTSFYEHAIWESFSGIDSVSTVKLLQLANEAGTPIYTINSANIDATLLKLDQAPAVKIDIQNVVAAGRVVTIPASAITRNEWHGTGYMARNPDTGEGAYIISNGYAGGGTTHPMSALGLLQRQYAAIALGKPADKLLLNSGIWYWFGGWYNEYINFRIELMLLAKGFIPRNETTFSKTEFLNLINRPDNWIVYYSGHGWSDNTNGDLLMPGYNSAGKGEYVYPSDIDANARIVFLNGCHTGELGSFKNAFGLDNQIFIGWINAVEYYDAGDFAFDWWRSFLSGISAAASAAGLDDGKYMTPDSDPKAPYLVIKGGGLTLNSLH